MGNACTQPQTSGIERQHLIVTGVVQGVGFRPFVYTLATDLRLSGFVGNDSAGVQIEVEGDPATLAVFRQRLVDDAPPLAHIDAVTVDCVAAQGSQQFVIVHSQSLAGARTLVAPDVATCDDCLREMRDPANRRFRYPFTNCTNCGPRFTIIQEIPYDRPFTTMARFPMCSACQAEYDDPHNRRFHAQPNACPVCGPQLTFVRKSGATLMGNDAALSATQRALYDGQIVAIKGLGGFHLACDARNEAAVQTLRERKARLGKPFALLARNLEIARSVAQIDADEQRLLTGRERPIVLLNRRADAKLAASVAPGNGHLGLMLPYTPLHHLLFDPTDACPALLVLTSGNDAGEPIVFDNDAALRELGHLADAWLLHDRAVHLPCDDSVVRVFNGHELPIRRSRGYAPFPVKLPFEVAPVLAVGGELKSTFCLADGHFAYMSQHIGDMENLETLEALGRSVAHFAAIFRVEPELIACDTHPGYLSARWAHNNAAGRPIVAVQHHHAHIAALMAEAGLAADQQVIGISFDGTGYGSDGAIWGGEVLLAGYAGFERFAHLNYIPLPGGDAAIKRPYRVALAHLHAAGVAWDDLPPVAACPVVERGVLAHQLATGFGTVPTSSMGRLFDAVAALVGVREVVSYEAQAAIEFEALHHVDADPAEEYRFALVEGAPLRFDAAPLIVAVAADVRAGVETQRIAARFHGAVATLIVELAMRARAASGLTCVALSGGVFQNITLLRLATERLQHADFAVLTHRQVPPNDGGLALGQAVVASFLHNRGG